MMAVLRGYLPSGLALEKSLAGYVATKIWSAVTLPSKK